ncbi:MAG TPA: YidC/Oxa1 family insertase periplasmic-domain containing protein, partial [Pirellulales bacterium]|nr:YidC/Oxa1 family insertase periplasmic-domain containing protein [Pirellulales bacterium]
MDRRFYTFLALSVAVVLVNILMMRWLEPPADKRAAPDRQAVAKREAAKEMGRKKGAVAAKETKDGETASAEEKKPAGKKQEDAEEPSKSKPAVKEQSLAWVTLGSADEQDPYRMLVTFTNRGAAVERIELNSRRFHDLDDRSGYLGHLNAIRSVEPKGCLVRVVGRGTPADRAGLKPDDVIVAANGQSVRSVFALHGVLAASKPGDTVKLSVSRDGKPLTLTATLTRKPLQIVRPEYAETVGRDKGEPREALPGVTDPKDIQPLSFLMTLERIDGEKLDRDEEELPGVKLRSGNWTLLPGDPKKPDEVAFEMVLPEHELRVRKIFSLTKLKAEEAADVNAPAYHLGFHLEIENLSDEPRDVAYRLDGPTGLPTEGWWYAYSSKIGRDWSSPGMRDAVVGYVNQGAFQHSLVSASTMASDESPEAFVQPLVYMGVDAQYFASVLIPQKQEAADKWFAESYPLRVGPIPDDKNKQKLVDVSCRLISEKTTLEPGGGQRTDRFQIFAGPKRPRLLARYAKPYGLGELVYYGWFGWVSRPMLGILHFFYDVVRNYGLAIIMLTVLVRSCMFPLSRKQALNAQKMQELQPEMKRLAEKYKGNVEQRTKAQQELFRKHNYNPLSGCLPALVQLPIFLGLYRSLAVDIELRQAPLLGEAIRWCSNLAAPDMLWYWEAILPQFLAGKTGWLGPYLNVLPLVT